jgi:hypothetical protein
MNLESRDIFDGSMSLSGLLTRPESGGGSGEFEEAKELLVL